MVTSAEIAVNGKESILDLGTFNQRPFVYVSAFGAFTEVTYKTSQKLKNSLGHLAYIISAIKSIPTIKSHEVCIKWNDGSRDHEINDSFMLGLISNSKSIGGFRCITGNDVKMDDGFFEVTLIKKIKNVFDIKNILMFMLRSNYKCNNIITFKAKSITLVSNDKISWTLDGEDAGSFTKVDIINHQKVFVIKSGL